jgi:hypothetical protein
MNASAFFDRTHRTPADITAALVVSKGERYRNEPRVMNVCTEAPPKIKPLPHNAPNLAGLRFGRFRVIGMQAGENGRWVVRCDCGNYEIRRTKAILNAANFGDRCTYCRNKAFERKEYERTTYGRQIDARAI